MLTLHIHDKKIIILFWEMDTCSPFSKENKTLYCMFDNIKKKKNGREQEFFLKHSKMCKKHKPLKQHRDMSKSCKQFTHAFMCVCVWLQEGDWVNKSSKQSSRISSKEEYCKSSSNYELRYNFQCIMILIQYIDFWVFYTL